MPSERTYGGYTAEQIKAAAQAATPGPWETVAGPFNTHVSSRSGFVVGGEGMASYGQDVINAHYIAAANPAVVLELIARLRAAEGALMAIHEFANDDGNWEHEEIIADDGMFIGCDGRYTVEAMASDALKGMSDAVPNV